MLGPLPSLAEALTRCQGTPTEAGPSNASPLVVASPAQDSLNPPVVVVAVKSDDEVTGE